MQIEFFWNCNRTHTQTVQAKPPKRQTEIPRFFYSSLGVRRRVKSTTAAVIAGSPHAISANFIPKFTNMRPTSTSGYTSFLILSDNGVKGNLKSRHCIGRQNWTGVGLEVKKKKEQKDTALDALSLWSIWYHSRINEGGVKGHASRERGVRFIQTV